MTYCSRYDERSEFKHCVLILSRSIMSCMMFINIYVDRDIFTIVQGWHQPRLKTLEESLKVYSVCAIPKWFKPTFKVEEYLYKKVWLLSN